ncbi:MAG: outer membrane protein assembly factor BamD [Alphaproteobacteria bacterium]
MILTHNPYRTTGPVGWGRMVWVLALVAVLSACASTKDEATEKEIEKTPDQVYAEAKEAVANKEYKKAAERYEELEKNYPYWENINVALMEKAQVEYDGRRYEDALQTLDRFIELYPADAQIDHAYYLKALCLYEQIVDVGRDQLTTQQADDALKAVYTLFPDSKYARDAKFKRDLTQDHLAGKDMDIGRFYLKQKEYPSAIRRFQTVIKQYDTTSHVPEALYRLVVANLAVGLVEEARRNAAVLAQNANDSVWYQRAFDALTEANAPPPANGDPSPPKTPETPQ